MFETTRRNFLKNSALVAASASLSQSFIADAFAADPLKIWTIGVAKVTKTWDEMGKQAGVPLVYSAKSGSADQARNVTTSFAICSLVAFVPSLYSIKSSDRGLGIIILFPGI